ncbi:MAG: translational GTPase TypA, partial [Defluviitaleaceae bacterium]|nr:translational GTPase TypA [Defluviitaleaceae bacterium]
IETMRREGYEFQVSKPVVLYKNIDGKRHEPMEAVTIDVPEEFTGVVIQKLGSRRGELQQMSTSKGGYTRLDFSIPARGLIGYRTEFLTDTKGNGIMNTLFDGFAPYKGDIPERPQGSLISFETGEAIPYGMYNAQERGSLFVTPGTKVYTGMVIGRHVRFDDMEVNICKQKKLTNVRASGSDDALRLVPAEIMSLEQCLEFISEDELLEITPVNLRIRKKILDATTRSRAKK